MVHGQALRMRLELQRLAQRHGVVLADAVTLPLVSYSDHDLIVEGYASTSDIDLTRMKFRSHAICWPPFTRAGDVPLLYRHDPAQPAGRVDSLDYDDRGRLLVRATVTHPEARRCAAFSMLVPRCCATSCATTIVRAAFTPRAADAVGRGVAHTDAGEPASLSNGAISSSGCQAILFDDAATRRAGRADDANTSPTPEGVIDHDHDPRSMSEHDDLYVAARRCP